MTRKSKKKRNRVPATGPVWVQTAEQATLAQMPLYNAHICRTGAHGKAKYCRSREMRTWRNELRTAEGRHMRPSPFR